MELDVEGWGDPIPRTRTRGMEEAAETAFALLDGLWLGPVGIAFVGPDLRLERVNGAFARLTGVAPAALAGRAPRDLFPGQDALAAAAEERLRSVFESGRPALDLSTTSRAPDGATRSWRASLYPVVAPGGGVRAVCALVDETTLVLDRERALERARGAAERNARRVGLLQGITAALSAAVEPAEIADAVIAPVRALTGADRIALLALEAGGLVPVGASGAPADGRGAAPVPAPGPEHDALAGERGVWLESPGAIASRYPHLGAGPGAIAALPLRARGRALGALSLSFPAPRELDLEERALLLGIAEHCALALDRARLLARERAMRSEAERDRAALDGVFANAPLGMALLDRELRFVRANPVLAAMNGAPVHAHLGRTRGEILPSLAWDDVARRMRRVLETGRPQVDVPIEVPGADGRARHFVEAWYPVHGGDATLGLGAIVREVTAERDSEQFQRNVLGIVGHDLRTPLTTVKTAAYLLGRGALDPAQARLVARIASAGARIEQVVGILVDYARASSGRGIPIRPHLCDLAAICREVADEAEGAHPGRSVRSAGDGDPSGEWDADRLRQALANLVTNALDHGAPDGPVHVRWRGDGAGVEIEVTNRGAPIPPDLLPRIFEAFRGGRRERPARRSGLGLGLFVARAIVAAHGGRIEVRSGAGETAFTIALPRRHPA